MEIEKPVIRVGNSKAVIIPDWYMKMRPFTRVKIILYDNKLVMEPIIDEG